MPVLGIRITATTIGLGLFVAGLGVLGAGAGGPGSTRYEVVAPLLSVGDGDVYACFSYAQSSSPTACSGVRVRGVDIRRIATVQGYAESPTLETPPVRLVGRWEEGALTLTEPPQPASAATPLPEPCSQPIGFQPSSDVMALQDRVVRDPAFANRNILFLESMPCEGRVGLLVAVADPETVSYLQGRYPAVVVTGWLQPISGW
jgi:hypothetical protein